MIVTPEAEIDMVEAQNFYDQRQEGLGSDLVRAIGQILRRIDQLPESYPPIYRQVRRALTRRFPFAIYYRIENGEAVILAVLHSRRDPKTWKERT